MVEQVLGDGGVVRVLGGARFSTASVREGTGKGESEREWAKGGAWAHRYHAPARCIKGPMQASDGHTAAYLCLRSAMTTHDAASIRAQWRT